MESNIMSRGDEPITDPASPSPELADELARLHKQLGDIASELEAVRDEAETRLSALQGELEDIAFGISKLEASIASAQATRANQAAERTVVEGDIAPTEESGAEKQAAEEAEDNTQPAEEAQAEPVEQSEVEPVEQSEVEPAEEAEAEKQPAAEAEAEKQGAEDGVTTQLAKTEPIDEPDAGELHAETAEEQAADEQAVEEAEVDKQPAAEAKGESADEAEVDKQPADAKAEKQPAAETKAESADEAEADKQPAAEAKGESADEAVVTAAMNNELAEQVAVDKGGLEKGAAKSDEIEEAATEKISADTKAVEHDAVVLAEAEKLAAAAAKDVARAMLVDLALDGPSVSQTVSVEATEQDTSFAGNKIDGRKSSEETSFEAILEQEFAEYFESSAPAQSAPTTTSAASNEDEPRKSVDDEWA
jgi:hypothetical protein